MYHAVDVIIVVIIGLLEAEWGNHDSTPHRTTKRAECADRDSKHHHDYDPYMRVGQRAYAILGAYSVITSE